MKSEKSISLPRAPIGQTAKVALAMFPGPQLFAHHPPTNDDLLKAPNARMERPRGGHGPHNVMER